MADGTTLTDTQWVYAFGGGGAEGSASMKNLLGGKGANLAEMSSLGLPVPPGFTVTTEACVHYYANGRDFPAGLREQVASGIVLEGEAGKPRTEAIVQVSPDASPFFLACRHQPFARALQVSGEAHGVYGHSGLAC